MAQQRNNPQNQANIEEMHEADDDLLSDDDESDMEASDHISKEFKAACNISISRGNFLHSKILAVKQKKPPIIAADVLQMYSKMAIGSLSYNKMDMEVWCRAIDSFMRQHRRDPGQGSQLDQILNKQLNSSLTTLVNIQSEIKEAADKLKQRKAEWMALQKKYMAKSNDMEDILRGDRQKLDGRDRTDGKRDIAEFSKTKKRTLFKISFLRIAVMRLLSRGVERYNSNPEFVSMMKHYHKDFTAAILLDRARSIEGENLNGSD